MKEGREGAAGGGGNGTCPPWPLHSGSPTGSVGGERRQHRTGRGLTGREGAAGPKRGRPQAQEAAVPDTDLSLPLWGPPPPPP